MPHLDDTQFASLQAVYEANPEIKEFFPTLAPVQAFLIQNQFGVAGPDGAVQFEPKNFTPPQFTARNGGFDLQRFDTTGKVTWVASVRPEFISVNCTAYDRWKNVKPQALAILRPFVDAAMARGATIQAIGLQYQDAFRLLDGASPDVTGQLFRKDSKYLPMHLFEQPSFWHCHQGWFSKAPDERRLLNNVATEVAEVNGTHFARIGGQHRMFATLADGLTPKPIASGEIDQILQCLHDENISVINGILSDGALKAIGCTVGGT
ncbi:MAG TPA: TIGR04255 family protein [Burkholderiaceae bacterium]|nr:TIGR04255 family protein [Burkholderiaceae bacterium]